MKQPKRMEITKLIEDYLLMTFTFTSIGYDKTTFSKARVEWRVLDKASTKTIGLQELIKHLRKVFPNMGSDKICTMWFAKNINITTNKIMGHMKKYILRSGSGTHHWVVTNRMGKKFLEEAILLEIKAMISHHHSIDMIRVIYDEWFQDEKLRVNKKIWIN